MKFLFQSNVLPFISYKLYEIRIRIRALCNIAYVTLIKLKQRHRQDFVQDKKMSIPSVGTIISVGKKSTVVKLSDKETLSFENAHKIFDFL